MLPSALAGQARAADYKVFLGEQVPCGFAKIRAVRRAFRRGRRSTSSCPGKVTIEAGTASRSRARPSIPSPTGRSRRPSSLPTRRRASTPTLDDAAGKPFYFDGLAKLVYNGAALRPVRPRRRLAGAKREQRHPLAARAEGQSRDLHLQLPEGGDVQLLCTIHPGMKGDGRRQAVGHPAPKSPAQVQRRALQDVTAAWAKTKSEAAAAKPPAKTVYMGVGDDATILGYFPSSLKVQGGHDGELRQPLAEEPHNITFGPKKYIHGLQKKTDLFPTGPRRPNQVAPFLLYGSEPKGGYTYDGTNHGNGFFATPVTIGPRRAAAALVEGHVHEARDVQVLLLDPRARHGRDDRRHAVTQRFVPAGAAGDSCSRPSRPRADRRCRDPAHAAGRRAARCASTGSPPCRSSGTSSRTSATRSTGEHLRPGEDDVPDGRLPASTRRTGRSRSRTSTGDRGHPGAAPATRDVGDTILVHFENLDTLFNRPHSMHFHGVTTGRAPTAPTCPGFSGPGANVQAGQVVHLPARRRPRLGRRLALPRPLAVDGRVDRGRPLRRALDPRRRASSRPTTSSSSSSSRSSAS